jgi:hypothetical protein
MKLSCAFCTKIKDEEEFTPFNKNLSLKDRNFRVVVCRECCSKFVEESKNTKEALKNILRIVDIPYLEKYADNAVDILKKKQKSTNLVTKENLYNKTKTQSVESNKLQTNIYTCYTSRLGVMPKTYTNFSFSDGIRLQDEIKSEKEVLDKTVESAKKFLINQFGEKLFEDKEKLSKAITLKFDEISLYTNNANQRQLKHKIKTSVNTLIQNNILDKNLFGFVIEDKQKQVVNTEEITNTPIEEDLNTNNIFIKNNNMDINDLKIKWGMDYKDEDLIKFELKYKELRKNYEIKTASHDEFLKHACVASVKATQCIAKDDPDGTKTWMSIFKDMTNAGKLQPSQMSKADLSGGLNNFGEFWKSLEDAKNVIEILPEFKKQPRDDADFVLYCNIQYMRRVLGLPDIKYDEIWKFYEELAEQFNIEDLDMDLDIEEEYEDYEDELENSSEDDCDD